VGKFRCVNQFDPDIGEPARIPFRLVSKSPRRDNHPKLGANGKSCAVQFLNHWPADRARRVVLAFNNLEPARVMDKQIPALIPDRGSKVHTAAVEAHQERLTVLLEFTRGQIL
jgi:hypothetical protein